MNQISFRGQLITNINIKKYGETNSTRQASVVKMNPLKYRDLNTLLGVCDLWNETFAGTIYKDADRINISRTNLDLRKFYVLTEQRQSYERVEPEDVLAEAEIVIDYPDKNNIYLEYLQVQPENMYESGSQLYKGIGSSFLSFLKDYYKNKIIQLRALPTTVDFYIKNGFKLVRHGTTLMKFPK